MCHDQYVLSSSETTTSSLSSTGIHPQLPNCIAIVAYTPNYLRDICRRQARPLQRQLRCFGRLCLSREIGEEAGWPIPLKCIIKDPRSRGYLLHLGKLYLIGHVGVCSGFRLREDQKALRAGQIGHKVLGLSMNNTPLAKSSLGGALLLRIALLLPTISRV